MVVDGGVRNTWNSAAESCFKGGDMSNSSANEFILRFCSLPLEMDVCQGSSLKSKFITEATVRLERLNLALG